MPKVIQFRPKIKDGKEAVDYPGNGKWLLINGRPTQEYDDSMMYRKFPVLKMESRDDSGIREVYEKYKDISLPDNSDATEIFQAIRKSIEGEEG